MTQIDVGHVLRRTSASGQRRSISAWKRCDHAPGRDARRTARHERRLLAVAQQDRAAPERVLVDAAPQQLLPVDGAVAHGEQRRSRQRVQRRPRSARQGAERPRDAVVEADRLQEGRVAHEELVAALADLDHLDAGVRGELRDVIERNADGIRDRLVLVLDEARQIVEHRAVVDQHLAVIGAVALGDAARVVQLVQVPGVLALVADRERVDRQVAALGHQRRARARVDAAGQEHAEGNVAHHAIAHGGAQAIAGSASATNRLVGIVAGVEARARRAHPTSARSGRRCDPPSSGGRARACGCPRTWCGGAGVERKERW